MPRAEARSQIETRVDGGIAFIDLGAPETGNKLDLNDIRALSRAVRDASARAEVRVIVIGGTGTAFCLGRDSRGDPPGPLTAYGLRSEVLEPIQQCYSAIATAPLPIVARVHGDALGLGSAIAGVCDIVLASASAGFGFPEIDHGVAPTLAMSTVVRKVSPAGLSYLVYSGERVDSAQAQIWGLASIVFSDESFSDRCDATLQKLSRQPRMALETLKKFQLGADGLSRDAAAEYGATLFAIARTSGQT